MALRPDRPDRLDGTHHRTRAPRSWWSRSPSTDVEVGDVIVFAAPETDVMTVHRIVAIDQQDGSPTFTTKGDANSGPRPLEGRRRRGDGPEGPHSDPPSRPRAAAALHPGGSGGPRRRGRPRRAGVRSHSRVASRRPPGRSALRPRLLAGPARQPGMAPSTSGQPPRPTSNRSRSCWLTMPRRWCRPPHRRLPGRRQSPHGGTRARATVAARAGTVALAVALVLGIGLLPVASARASLVAAAVAGQPVSTATVAPRTGVTCSWASASAVTVGWTPRPVVTGAPPPC